MVNDTDLKRTEESNYKVQMSSLKTTFEVGNSGQHYTPGYDSVYKSVPSQSKPTSFSMAETIIRPPNAGTREAEDYSASFNKEKLGNLKSMFEQKRKDTNVAETKKFVPDFTRSSSGVGKVATSSANNPHNRDPNVIYSVAGEREVADYRPSVSIASARSMFEQKKPAEYKPKNKVQPGKITMPKLDKNSADGDVVKNSDVVDDRPKELSTSLLSARAMFEGGNRASNSNTIVKEVASWDGKGENDVLGSAKAVFAAGDTEMEKKGNNYNDELETEPELVECFMEQNETEAERLELESPIGENPVIESPVVESPIVERPIAESPVMSPVVASPVVETEHLQEEIVEQEQEQEVTQPAEDEVLPETLCTTTENPAVVEQHYDYSETTTQPSFLPIDETAPTTVEPTPEVECTTTLEVNTTNNNNFSPENASLEPSPAKNGTEIKVNKSSTNQSKDDDYDSADVLSDAATTTSQEGDNNQK